MTTLDIVTFFVYLVGSVTFILGLKFLASPVSARRGNRLAATGLNLAESCGLPAEHNTHRLSPRSFYTRTTLS